MKLLKFASIATLFAVSSLLGTGARACDSNCYVKVTKGAVYGSVEKSRMMRPG